MKEYLMTLTPQEPYFFGNEKNFKYPGQAVGALGNKYFIKSELVPAQSTLLGTLRYILLPIKKNYKEYSADDIKINNEAVGEYSFKYGGKNEFGKIKEISPLFLMKGEEILIHTPFDHVEGKDVYTPFSDYEETLDGEHLYTNSYDSKRGVSRSFMSLSDGTIYGYDEIFGFETRVGINRAQEDGGFFKKEYATIKAGFSFAAYITLEDDAVLQNMPVFMGQGKSLFIAQFTEAENKLEERVAPFLSEKIVYCLSDAFVGSDIYANTLFAVTDTRDYRAYTTTRGEVAKGSVLYKNICAGSVFIPKNMELFCKAFENASVSCAGYNKIIKREEV